MVILLSVYMHFLLAVERSHVFVRSLLFALVFVESVIVDVRYGVLFWRRRSLVFVRSLLVVVFVVSVLVDVKYGFLFWGSVFVVLRSALVIASDVRYVFVFVGSVFVVV